MDFESIEELKSEDVSALYNQIIEGELMFSWANWYVDCANGRRGRFIDNQQYACPVGSKYINYNEDCMTTCPKYFNTTCNVCGTGCQTSYIYCAASASGYRCGREQCI